jgi:O-antigen/teichoic acid export membrane protein
VSAQPHHHEHRHPHALDANVRQPAVDGAPPVSPNSVRAPEVRKIHQNFLETLIFKGISSPLALVLVVVQGRYLHTSGRGAFVLVVLSVTILTHLLGQLGYAVSNRMQQKGANVRQLVQAALAIGVVLGVSGTGAIVAWGAFTPGVGVTVSLIAALALVPNVIWQCICGVLLGLNRVRLWNVIQTVPQVMTLVWVLALVVGLHMGVTGAVLAWTLAHVCTAVYALYATRDVWPPMPIKDILELYNRPLARLALTMGAVQVVQLISYRVELIVLERSRSVTQVGIYSIAVQTTEMLWLIAGSMTTAVTGPALQDDEKKAADLIAKTAVKAFVYSAVVAVAVGAAVPYAFGPLLGHGFSGAGTPLRLLLPGTVVYAPVTVLVVYLSVRRGKPHMSLAVSVVGLVGTLVAALILIPRYGSSGAGAASSVGYAAGTVLCCYFFVRLARRPDPVSAPVAAHPSGG